MPHLILTNEPAFKIRTPGSDTLVDVPLPTGVGLMTPEVRPCFTLYKKRTYISGMFNKNLIWTEHFKLRESGITASTEEAERPVAVEGTGTGITATAIRYVYTFAEISPSGQVVVHESDVSLKSVVIDFVDDKSIDVSGMAITHDNDRVNFKRLYRSDNGGDYRFVSNVAIGTATYTDTTPTLDLGAVAPINHGVAPYTKFTETYHDRIWYAGDPKHPDRIYYSERFEGEAVGPLNYLVTRDGEGVTGIKRSRDELVIFCEQSSYAIQGYSEADFSINKISPTVGCISHHSIVNIDEVLFFASELGVYIYNGSFRYMSEDIRHYWKADYLNNTAAFQDSVAIDDRFYSVYKLLTPRGTDGSIYYVAYYPPVFTGSQPYWSFDARNREDKTLGLLAPSAALRFDQYVGSCDGWLRKDNDDTDADDDGDSNQKAMAIETGALLFSDPGGSIEEGKTFSQLWSYVQAEDNAWFLYMLGGDEDVVNATTPENTTIFWKDEIAATASAGKTAKSVHMHSPEQVSGRALQVRIFANAPLNMKFRGLGGTYTQGPATRPTTD